MTTQYQGSRHSTASVTIYPNLGDGTFGEGIKLTGSVATSDRPAIIGLHVQNALGQGASFSVNIKRAGYADPLMAFPIDSWIDICLGEHGQSWHVLRGLIDEVRVNVGASGTGATVHIYTLVGRSFQKIWEDTPAMFNPYLGDKEVSAELISALQDLRGSPDTLCKVLLFDILRSLGQKGRGYWAMPPHMPGASGLFVDTAQINLSSFNQYDIARVLVRPSIYEGGPLWNLAQQYSDPAFCEFFTELMPAGSNLAALGPIDTTGTSGLDPKNSRMVVFLRDRPFMAVDPSIGPGPLGAQSPYFQLPQFVVSRQTLTSFDFGRSSYERRNAFYLGPPPDARLSDHFITFKQPLWDTADQNAHGLRQMTIQLGYNLLGRGPAQNPTDIDSAFRAAKRLVRDYYCLNADFYSGSVALAQGSPWMKVGCRLRIDDAMGDVQPFHGYIEAISHDFSPMVGTRTSLSFTRGFFGDEHTQLQKLIKTSVRYVEPYITLAQGATQ